MSQPMRNPHVNARECPTELAAVWYAANFYYQASYNRAIEYGGIVFKWPNGKFGVTVRRGAFTHTQIHWEDQPEDAETAAIWHTHIPLTRAGSTPLRRDALELFEFFSSVFEAGYEDFSPEDKALAEEATKAMQRISGTRQRIPIYLVTATVIKRYTPGATPPITEWSKKPPSRMRRFQQGSQPTRLRRQDKPLRRQGPARR